MAHEKYSSVIQALHECMEACNHCYDECLNEENVKSMSECIRLDRECADICSFLEQSLSRNSPFIKETANLCIEACKKCADECKKHNHDHCQKCAESCRKCADECEKLVS
ncbi:four-helix bundle copper-binding protein [Bacillus taeanensis]|uniref:Four-helix bundle copper-binding protein n=1 Tax=Bacillus taeanensis TaxID=273032 RepID=A0A366XX41_9BACI|nr:four-helix bundle copper-binding protein [Bacillus taeanensis]RBW70960.1 four-helix bundle copper-binding protein [Bacillus taeanensis]